MDQSTLSFLGIEVKVEVKVAADNSVSFHVDPKSKKDLERYLNRALPSFVPEITEDSVRSMKLAEKIQVAVRYESTSDTPLSDPMTRLPHDVPISTKNKLIEIKKVKSSLTDEKYSATRVLVDIIDKNYAKLFPEE